MSLPGSPQAPRLQASSQDHPPNPVDPGGRHPCGVAACYEGAPPALAAAPLRHGGRGAPAEAVAMAPPRSAPPLRAAGREAGGHHRDRRAPSTHCHCSAPTQDSWSWPRWVRHLPSHSQALAIARLATALQLVPLARPAQVMQVAPCCRYERPNQMRTSYPDRWVRQGCRSQAPSSLSPREGRRVSGRSTVRSGRRARVSADWCGE
mmetsp:Transcript_132976/g.297580  ORF Transcript_132976/g.297580 Transcript_132976/m.297580 type:complete len:206 (+) Transcript_132976:392-1009(+)